VITRDLRHSLARAAAAAGFERAADPGLRPTGTPGQYAASVAFTLGQVPRETAQSLAAQLADERWIARVEVTGPGYLTITVTPEALAAVADRITAAGPACVTSDALAGLTVPAAPPGDPLNAPTWEKARTALGARLTARLAAAAGATVADFAASERVRLTLQATSDPESGVSRTRSEDPETEPDVHPQRQGTAGSGGPDTMAVSAIGPAAARTGGYGGSLPREMTADVAAVIAFAGRDAVTFTLARAIPRKPLRVEAEIIARHVPGNPAYAVRYAHARAASGVRWAAASSAVDTRGATALLDALSWLPERVAAAARRGRPDEFARYLEDLASVTVDVLSSARHPGSAGLDWAAAPGSDRLTLAMAARTGLAAGLGLLEVAAPERL
jgi:arginyl-tRNA synthetase